MSGERVRLDKWLWAARFYKTRALSREAIEGGKVQVNGDRAKPSKDIGLGMTIRLRQGHDLREVIVRGLSEQRGPASVAQQLYEETSESLERREQAAEERRVLAQAMPDPGDRPSKKERRQRQRFRDLLDDL